MQARPRRGRAPLQDRTNLEHTHEFSIDDRSPTTNAPKISRTRRSDPTFEQTTKREQLAVEPNSRSNDSSTKQNHTRRAGGREASLHNKTGSKISMTEVDETSASRQKQKRRSRTHVGIGTGHHSGTLAGAEYQSDDLGETEEVEGSHVFSATDSVLRATPLATQISSQALTRFKRRPRQPSMLAMVQQRLASARTSPADPANSHSASRSAYEFDEIEDDFVPDMAGTPQHVTRPISLLSSAIRPPKQRSARRKKEFTGAKDRPGLSTEDVSCATQVDRVQERNLLTAKSIVVGNNRRSLRQARPSGTAAQDWQDHTDYVSAHETAPVKRASNDSSVAPEAQLLSAEEHNLADHSLAISPDTPALSAMSIINLTPSPARGRSKRRKLNKIPSTADLQSMLPRRRHAISRDTSAVRQGICYSLDAESPTADDSSYTPGYGVIYRAASLAPGSQARRGDEQTGRKSANHGQLQRTPPRKIVRRRVKRNVADENADQHLDDAPVAQKRRMHQHGSSPGSEPPAHVSSSGDDDLAAERNKFAEIDRWQLDFENVTPEDTASSGQDYR